ncbi:MAG: hypothetical protein K8F91_26680 [Candidatus Obscuribacterales bacterium]|nr:hypothetical protein [Candidatus Obscuribacterales bacterium]
MPPDEPYNPLDKKNLGYSVAEAMLLRPLMKLPPDEAFGGAGIYAIYYFGSFKPYKRKYSARTGYGLIEVLFSIGFQGWPFDSREIIMVM